MEDEEKNKEENAAREYLDKIGAAFHYDCYTEKKPEGNLKWWLKLRTIPTVNLSGSID